VGTTRRGRRRARARLDATGLAREIRSELDAGSVLMSVARILDRETGARKVCIWLWRPGSDPTHLLTTGPDEDIFPSDDDLTWLRKAAESSTSWRMPTPRGPGYASVIVAPQSGPLAIACVVHPQIDGRLTAFVDAVAEEAGFALETANLYAKALEEKEKSAAILDRVGDAVFVTDATGNAKEWNRVAEWHLGLPPSSGGGTCEALLGLNTDDGPLDCASGCALMRLQHTDHVGTMVWRALPDGRRQPLLATATPLTDAGDVYGVVHSMRDVTRLKEAEEAKNLFLATASHELRTPLTVIQGFAQLMQNSDYAPEGGWQVAVDAIARRSKQLDGIIERILLSSRIEGANAEIHREPTDIRAILIDEVESNASSRDRTITLDMDEVPKVLADARAFTTVIQHLIENAIKYSPGGQRVDVRVWSDVEQVHVSVRDRGIGMAPDHVERCFDKFWQAESSDVRRFGGTGIGLFIVRSLCVAMGGGVEVVSAPGQGSTFTVSLQRAEISVAADPDAAPAPVNERPARTPLHRRVDPVSTNSAAAGAPGAATPAGAPRRSERSTIREFMRQIGVPTREIP
jgi:PAS domain S-box-containing protein